MKPGTPALDQRAGGDNAPDGRMTKPQAIGYLKGLSVALERAHRSGAEDNDPEGVRFVRMSDRLVDDMAVKLYQAAEALQ